MRAGRGQPEPSVCSSVGMLSRHSPEDRPGWLGVWLFSLGILAAPGSRRQAASAEQGSVWNRQLAACSVPAYPWLGIIDTPKRPCGDAHATECLDAGSDVSTGRS